jgi:hypothetical protein
MKRPVVFILFMMVIALPVVPVFAAELLDVKPVVAGTDLVVEILADIPLTYSYYKVPGGPARAVVDIADADPEKIEPLIVVNQGAVSSISVDKAQISGMVVSRLIFNLVSDADISVTASTDRKKLTVAFSGKPVSGGSEKPAALSTKPAPAPLASPAAAPVAAPAAAKNEADPLGLDEPAAAPAKSEPAAAPATAKSGPATARDEADPLGLDEHLAATPEGSAPAAKAAATPAVPAVVPHVAPPAPTASVKLEPVVPVMVPRRGHSAITAIKVTATYIDIEATGRLDDFSQMKLTGPNRLVIDVPGATSSLSDKGIPVRRFGLAQVRVGRYPDHTRIVFDAGSSPFPKYEIKSTDTGMRINFK